MRATSILGKVDATGGRPLTIAGGSQKRRPWLLFVAAASCSLALVLVFPALSINSTGQEAVQGREQLFSAESVPAPLPQVGTPPRDDSYHPARTTAQADPNQRNRSDQFRLGIGTSNPQLPTGTLSGGPATDGGTGSGSSDSTLGEREREGQRTGKPFTSSPALDTDPILTATDSTGSDNNATASRNNSSKSGMMDSANQNTSGRTLTSKNVDDTIPIELDPRFAIPPKRQQLHWDCEPHRQLKIAMIMVGVPYTPTPYPVRKGNPRSAQHQAADRTKTTKPFADSGGKNPNAAKEPSVPSLFLDSFVNKATYAVRHGYDLIWEQAIPKRMPSLHWTKIFVAMSRLHSYDWIVLLDADALIMDMNRTLESLVRCDAQIIVSKEAHNFMLNTGVLFLHNDRSTLHVLMAMTRTPKESWAHPHYEQGAFNYLWRAYSGVRAMTLVYPQQPFNTFPAVWCFEGGQRYRAGIDFIVHFVAMKYCLTLNGTIAADAWTDHVAWAAQKNQVTALERQRAVLWYATAASNRTKPFVVSGGRAQP
jgi:hypothetical protein